MGTWGTMGEQKASEIYLYKYLNIKKVPYLIPLVEAKAENEAFLY